MTSSNGNSRKLDHIKLAIEAPGDRKVSSGWDDVKLCPVSLPIFDRDDVFLGTHFLGFPLKAPIMIAGMTGGHVDTKRINENLAIAARECGVAMGVGSQRAALGKPELESTYSVVRKNAPNAFICGNIGISQLAAGKIDSERIIRLVDMVEANAMAVHINVLQELVQPEGSIELKHAFSALELFIEQCPVPVLVKETGCGLDRKTALRLKEIGVAALDVGGAGGTSFVLIEGARARDMGEERKFRLSQTFADWGLTTVASVKEIRSIGLPIIATGGVRSGLDCAKALSLGADLAGIGRQILKAALLGPAQTVTELQIIIEELTLAMLMTESRDAAALRSVDKSRS